MESDKLCNDDLPIVTRLSYLLSLHLLKDLVGVVISYVDLDHYFRIILISHFTGMSKNLFCYEVYYNHKFEFNYCRRGGLAFQLADGLDGRSIERGVKQAYQIFRNHETETANMTICLAKCFNDDVFPNYRLNFYAEDPVITDIQAPGSFFRAITVSFSGHYSAYSITSTTYYITDGYREMDIYCSREDYVISNEPLAPYKSMLKSIHPDFQFIQPTRKQMWID